MSRMHQIHLRFPVLLALIAAATAPAADPVGPWSSQWALRDPLAETARMIAADGTVESAIALGGDRLRAQVWAGPSAAGTRSGGAVVLRLPPGQSAAAGLTTGWTIRERALSGSGWIDYPRTQQDALWWMGVADVIPSALSGSHGSPSRLDETQGFARVVLVLPWRQVIGGGYLLSDRRLRWKSSPGGAVGRGDRRIPGLRAARYNPTASGSWPLAPGLPSGPRRNRLAPGDGSQRGLAPGC